MKNPKSSARRRTIIVLLVLLCIGGVALLCLDRALYPSAAEVESIKPGMTTDDVRTILGVLYDRSQPGEYSDVDQILEERGRGEAISSVMSYRIAGSIKVAWILCDGEDRVIEVWIEERGWSS